MRGRGRRAYRTRFVAAGAAAVTVAAGLGVRAVADGAPAKYAGDALYTVLICALVVLCAPRARPPAVAGTGLVLSWAVELLQLTGVPAELSRHGAVARLVLGSTFNAPDLLWYAVGAAAAWGVHTAALRGVRAMAAESRAPVPPTSASR
ncbi:ribosomal maturation YjgA family protein [Streptomyces brevispora]|uniref:Uncharacterized protein DUF2809 n=1 Tax=Streptomyces brevispora TaxID=887462 RepID=A0A561V017_9ACTN|nr:DUF2809 domain-containing protein [Streptomyces brevispora]TWG04927.1 uncharacterized protein DUF2809 [Streptomyces brevispora]